MSFREESGDGRDLQKPFLHTGSWYKMGSRQSSVMGSTTSVMREGSVSVLFCVLIAALGPIQFGFTVCFNSISILFESTELKKKSYWIWFLFYFFFCLCLGKVWIFFADATSYNQRSKALCFRGFVWFCYVCFCSLWRLVYVWFQFWSCQNWFWHVWLISSRIDSTWSWNL